MKGARTIDLSRAGDPKIRSDKVGTAASQVAAIPAVRQALFDFQKSFLDHPPGHSPGAVMDGRDIGTVIAPDATAKLFVDARAGGAGPSPLAGTQGLGISRNEAELLAEIVARDAADRSRADFAPETGPGRQLARYHRH